MSTAEEVFGREYDEIPEARQDEVSFTRSGLHKVLNDASGVEKSKLFIMSEARLVDLALEARGSCRQHTHSSSVGICQQFEQMHQSRPCVGSGGGTGSGRFCRVSQMLKRTPGFTSIVWVIISRSSSSFITATSSCIKFCGCEEMFSTLNFDFCWGSKQSEPIEKVLSVQSSHSEICCYSFYLMMFFNCCGVGFQPQ